MKTRKKKAIEEYEDYLSTYKSINKEVTENNLNILKIFSALGAFIFLMLVVSTYFNDSLLAYKNIYISLLIVTLVVTFLSRNIKEVTGKKVRGLMYLLIFALWIIELVFSTIVEPNEVTVSYIVLIIAVPLIFIENRLILGGLIIFSDVVYITLAHYTQTPEIFNLNLTNIIPYSILSILISGFVVGTKIKAIEFKHKLDIVAKKEELEKEKESNRKSFVSDMIQFASQKEDAESIIHEYLQYMVDNFGCDRAYIFEGNDSGTYDVTYECLKEGVEHRIKNFDKSLYDAAFNNLITEVAKSKSVMIEDFEVYKEKSPDLYNSMQIQHINSLIVTPIIIDEKIIGLYGVDNPIRETILETREIVEMMEFAIIMMIKLRDDKKNIEHAATHDSLTDCKNRIALNMLYTNTYEHVAVAECDLNGLKRINDNLGHEDGDKYIIEIANALKDVFGKEEVYRTGGDEFYIIDTVLSLDEFKEKLEKIKEIVKDKGSFGYAYSSDGKQTIEELMRIADKEMYAAKNEYYRTSGIERRRR